MPTFLPIPRSPADHPSRVPVDVDPKADVQHDHPQQASCTLNDGREVKARYADTGTDAGWRYSVWVGMQKVVSREKTESGCDLCLTHSITISKNDMRVCQIRYEDDDVYKLEPRMVRCGGSAPLRGARDFVEYPLNGSVPENRVGKIQIVAATDPTLCSTLIIDEAKEMEKALYRNNDYYRDVLIRIPLGSEVVTLRTAGGEVDRGKKLDLGEGATDTFISQLDLFNVGHSQNVYRLTGISHYFSGDFLLATEPDVSREDVLKRLKEWDDIEEIPRLAAQVGWNTIGGDRYTSYQIFKYSNRTYVLETTFNDPAATLLLPTPEGKTNKVCTFQPVRANL
jgi:hypothetical protein